MKIEGNKIDRLYNLSEIEKILGVSRETLFNYMRSGKLEAIKIGGKWKVKEETLKKLIASGNQKTADN